jgi:hypothetical protein
MIEDHVVNEQSYGIFFQLSQSPRIDQLKWVMWAKTTRLMNISKQGLFNYLNHFEIMIQHW